MGRSKKEKRKNLAVKKVNKYKTDLFHSRLRSNAIIDKVDYDTTNKLYKIIKNLVIEFRDYSKKLGGSVTLIFNKDGEIEVSTLKDYYKTTSWLWKQLSEKDTKELFDPVVEKFEKEHELWNVFAVCNIKNDVSKINDIEENKKQIYKDFSEANTPKIYVNYERTEWTFSW